MSHLITFDYILLGWPQSYTGLPRKKEARGRFRTKLSGVHDAGDKKHNECSMPTRVTSVSLKKSPKHGWSRMRLMSKASYSSKKCDDDQTAEVDCPLIKAAPASRSPVTPWAPSRACKEPVANRGGSSTGHQCHCRASSEHARRESRRNDRPPPSSSSRTREEERPAPLAPHPPSCSASGRLQGLQDTHARAADDAEEGEAPRWTAAFRSGKRQENEGPRRGAAQNEWKRGGEVSRRC